MDAAEVLRVFEASLSQIKWRLKPSSKSRLQTDIIALCSRMRPCIMVDYGGKMPELGDHLCAFLSSCRKESSVFELLHVMVIDDMVYLIQVRALADFVESSLSMDTAMLFVDLENDPPKMTTQAEESPAIMQLLSAQKLFSSVFHADGVISNILQRHETCTTSSSLDGDAASESPKLVDLSCCLLESHVTIPTFNGTNHIFYQIFVGGILVRERHVSLLQSCLVVLDIFDAARWLLGYPVIYLFGKDYIDRAVYNLSTKSLHIYQIYVNRVNASSKGYRKEELMSFTVPYEVSLEGSNEAWAESFLAQMRGRWENCRHIWNSLSMEVTACYPQAIAL